MLSSNEKQTSYFKRNRYQDVFNSWRDGFPLEDAAFEAAGRHEAMAGQERDARHVRRVAEELERLGVALRVRVSVDADAAEVVGDGDDVEFFRNVDGVDVGAVSDLRPNTQGLESEGAVEKSTKNEKSSFK